RFRRCCGELVMLPTAHRRGSRISAEKGHCVSYHLDTNAEDGGVSGRVLRCRAGPATAPHCVGQVRDVRHRAVDAEAELSTNHLMETTDTGSDSAFSRRARPTSDSRK